jgi:hypothetical protein
MNKERFLNILYKFYTICITIGFVVVLVMLLTQENPICSCQVCGPEMIEEVDE